MAMSPSIDNCIALFASHAMPSFLSKVFGRKKEDAPVSPTSPKGHKSHPSLLEGKFEAVITPDSPIATNFAEAYGQPKDKEGGFGLFGAKSRPSTAPLPPTKRVEELPTLSLNLPGQKEENGSRVLGVVFEGDRQVLLDDSVIGAKRLNPAETLALVQACSNIITERGASRRSNILLCRFLTCFGRPRNSWDYASPLALCLAGYPTPSHFPFHPIHCKKEPDYSHTLSDRAQIHPFPARRCGRPALGPATP